MIGMIEMMSLSELEMRITAVLFFDDDDGIIDDDGINIIGVRFIL